MSTKPEGKHKQTLWREQQVAEMLLKGYTRQEIVRWGMSDKGWGICESQMDKYIAGARETIKNPANVDVDAERHQAHARFSRLLREAEELIQKSGDDINARARAISLVQSIQVDMNKLLGTNQQTQQVEITTRVPLIDMPPERVWEEIAQRWALSEQHIRLIDAPQDEGETDEG